MAKNTKVLDRADIESGLTDLKTASKDLKAFSDARMKDIDEAMKDIANVAKDDSGNAVINRLRGTEFNRTRMFIAGNYLASIFAVASNAKGELVEYVTHIKQYAVPEAK
jgi:uncharacterized protein YbjQ (UPF0145 family)